MSGGFPPNNAASARNYTEIKQDGEVLEQKCVSIDVVGEMLRATQLGDHAVQLSVGVPQYGTEPVSPEPNQLYVFKDVVRTIGGGLAAIGLLTGPGVSHYYLRYRTSDSTTVSLELT